MIAGRKKRRALRIAALVAAAGPVVALVTACSAPGGTAGARDAAPGHAAARTGCVFRDGRGHCQSGDCAGRYQYTGNGAIPATLAEYDMNAWDGLDFYDVSMVDGSNLPE